MSGFVAQVVAWLGAAADAAGRLVLVPVGLLPGWLSATAIAAVTGVLLLVAFKYTSSQRTIKRVRDEINANLLALRLFKDSAAVTLRAQGGMIRGGLRLMALSLVPMLAMALPVMLLLGQLSLWYQSRPLRVGEEAIVTMQLGGTADAPWPEVQLRPAAAAEVAAGPVRVRSRREVCWRVRAREAGAHRLVFDVGGQPCDKELAVGDGFMRVSALRPGWDWSEILLNPGESPFRPGSPVRSIAIDYPGRSSWTSGRDSWVIYWFAASMVAALCFRKALGVHV
jgi:hypothetical protein